MTADPAEASQGESADSASKGTSHHIDVSEDASKVSKGIATIAAIVAVAGGVIGLVFKLDPSLSPCLSGSGATFTGAPVFPQYPYQQFLVDRGMSLREALKIVPDPTGVEIRFSYRAEDLRGQKLRLVVTLERVDRDGTARAAVLSPFGNNYVGDTGEVTNYPLTVGPKCSEVGGGLIFTQLPQTRGHYDAILELSLGQPQDRIALTRTPIFDG